MPTRTDPSTFADRLRALMQARGWTDYRLARESGITASAIGKILAGKNQPTWPTVCAIADALDYPLDRFR